MDESKVRLAEGYNNFGCSLQDYAYYDDAIAMFNRAIEVIPDYPEVWTNLGSCYYKKFQFDKAVKCHNKAVEIAPHFAEAYSNLSVVLADQGFNAEAIEALKKSVEIKPEFLMGHSNLICQMDMSGKYLVKDLQEERARFGEKLNNAERCVLANDKNPDRKLKIGYIGADFRAHSATYVFSEVLKSFDRDNFEVYVYHNHLVEDRTSTQIKEWVTRWRNIALADDYLVINQIKLDEIDVLVDLSGHSAGNRLDVLARKPAPVQVTAWGYIGGTGLDSVDAFFADPVMVPEEEKELYAEEVRYLPNVISGYNYDKFPDVNESPVKDGWVTFGSFNRLVKTSPEVFKTWAEIMRQIPDARLIIKSFEMEDAETRERVLSYFDDKDRVLLLGKTSWFDHVRAYNFVDIALDPFPHGGGVTAMESIMMGVPVITWKCPTLVGRLSSTILNAVCMNDWVADSKEEYILLAKQKAADVKGLEYHRKTLRDRLLNSAIYSKEYVNAVEAEYRLLWKRWCES